MPQFLPQHVLLKVIGGFEHMHQLRGAAGTLCIESQLLLDNKRAGARFGRSMLRLVNVFQRHVDVSLEHFDSFCRVSMLELSEER